jgi:methylglutamate dehydrogenase subunit D
MSGCMSEQRSLPLRDVAKPGRFGAEGAPGVTLSIIHPVTLVAVMARQGKIDAVAGVLKSMRSANVMWAGPGQYFVEGLPPAKLKEKLGASASIIDQSHARVVIRIAGSKARAVLAKGTPVDLHPDHFPLRKSVMTQMAHIGVHMTRTGADEFTISVFRGFSESFWEWLTTSSAGHGYEVV